MKTLSDLKQMFLEQVSVDNIKYGWDGGHSYSYIDHPLSNVDEVCEHLTRDEYDEYDQFTHDWLYGNDNCPPCQLEIINGQVCSGCGCHNGLDYIEDREQVEDIINELENFKE